MTLMFCSFEDWPLILRTYGHARVYHPRDPGWDRLAPLFPELPGARDRRSGHRPGAHILRHRRAGRVRPRPRRDLLPFYDAMGKDGVEQYWARKNRTSIDGKATGTA